MSYTIQIDPKPYGLYAWGLMFDRDANVVAETESRLYIGYTRAEIRAEIRAELRAIAKEQK